MTAAVRSGGRRVHRWRVVVAVPQGGFGRQMGVMQAWLDHLCGPADWSAAPAGAGGVVNDALAFYFADRAIADAFVNRFCCGFRPQPTDRGQ